jgi:hypothetical protein
MLPGTGEGYLATPLFEPFGAEMNEEELSLSRSTPGYQMTCGRSARRGPRAADHRPPH